MNALQVFAYGDSMVRIIDVEGSPWWVAKEVSAILGYDGAASGTLRILDDDEKGVQRMHTPGGMQDTLCVSESGLYTLIFRSNKPEAKVFRRWVTHEVLPQIRKTGAYSNDTMSLGAAIESMNLAAANIAQVVPAIVELIGTVKAELSQQSKLLPIKTQQERRAVARLCPPKRNMGSTSARLRNQDWARVRYITDLLRDRGLKGGHSDVISYALDLLSERIIADPSTVDAIASK